MFTLSLTAHLSQIRRLFDLNTPQNSSDFTVVGQAFKSNTPSIKVKSAFRSHFLGLFPLGHKPSTGSLSPANVPARAQNRIATKMLPLGKNCDSIATQLRQSYRSLVLASRIKSKYTSRRIDYFSGLECAICPVVDYYNGLNAENARSNLRTQSMEKRPLEPIMALNSSFKDYYLGQLLGQISEYRDKKMSQLSLLGIVGASCNR